MGLLDKQVAIVTGAGQGLGKTIALEFAQEGAAVALLEINAETVKAVEAEIRASGGEARAYPLDITDYDAYAAAVADLLSWKGKIDVLVNNAAIAIYGTILTDTLDAWRKQISVNLEAVYMGSKLVAPHMVEKRYGRIISITSIQGFASSGDCGAYNSAKGAIIAFTKSMAVELGQYNILVNAVAPGFMRTPMSFVNGVDETTTPDFIEWYVNRGKVPLRRTGYPEDVSGTVVFLASSYCRYMTGQLLVVDGGLMSTF
ncbi:MAG: SDR family oxidoreductase [Anaerolineae bacterium]|nr:MAG: SDR family oxidoreductase [Anaerolineae bacterium]